MKKRFERLMISATPEGGDGGGGGGGGAPASAAEAPPVHFNPDGTFGDGWAAGLGDEFSPHADALKDFKDVKGLAKSYLHFRKTGPAYPSEGAQPEDVTRFRGLAQVPVEGTPTAYGITLPDTASDLDKSVMDRLSKVAHDGHLSAPGFQKVVAEYQKIQAEVAQQFSDEQAAQAKAAEDALVADWRGDFETNKSTVRHWATTLASSAGVDPSDPAFSTMVENPAFGKMMLEVSKLVREDGIRTPAGLGDLRSPDQRANSIMDGSDPVWGEKYLNGTDEEKAAAYGEVSRLLNKARA